jgi:diguanylate cyclase (GGDEF)-like protein
VARPLRVGTEVQRLGTVVAVAALVIVVISVSRLFYAALVTGPEADDLRTGQIAVEDARNAVLASDTFLRAYVTTGDRYFLERSTELAPHISAAESTMLDTLDQPDIFPSVLELVALQRRWQDDWARRLAAPAPPGPPGAAGSGVARGDVSLADYRRASAALRTLVIDATDDADGSRRALQRTFIIVTALVAGTALALAWRGRRVLLRHVVVPVDGLLAAVRGIGEGRLTPPEPVEGSAELVALRDGIAAMTVALRGRREQTATQAERLQAQTDRLRTILIMAREIAGSLNIRYVLDSTVQAAVAVTDGRVLLWLVDEESGGLELAQDSDRGAVAPMEVRCALGVGVVGRSSRYGQIARGDRQAGEDAAVAVPLVMGARVIGVLECCDQPGAPVEGQRLSTVEMLATLSGSAIEASRLHAATERLSQFDPLTQLGNRRRLGVDLEAAVAHARRDGAPMAVIMIDLDHFKELNDRYGHHQGDVVLQDVAGTLRRSMRDGATAYRYGGEEFAVLLTRGGVEDAVALAERLRRRVEDDFRRGDRQLITGSFGVAGLPDHATDPEALLSEADRALYAAKSAGRNRVERAV